MGEFSDDWPLRKLGDPEVCILRPSKREVAGLADSTEVSFVPMTRIDAASGRMDAALTRPLGEVKKGYTYFAEGDVVFAKITPCMENGKAAIARGLKNGVGFGTTELHVMRPSSAVCAEWLHLHVRRTAFREAARMSMNGAAGQQRVPMDFLMDADIPVPPLREQQRIVTRIAALSRRGAEARRLAVEREEELDRLIQAVYDRMVDGAERLPLKQAASLVRRPVAPKPDKKYEEMGIRSFGKGTFKKPSLTGRQIGRKRIYRIHEGDLVFNNVFAWEGAVAVAQAADHGRVGSHRFITYVPHEGKATSEFLCRHFLSAGGLEDIRAASPGSAGRNRTLGLKKLEEIRVPVPDYGEQVRFSEIVKRRRLVRQESAKVAEDLTAYEDALTARAFRGEL